MRRDTLALHALNSAICAADAVVSEDEQRRRVMAQRDRELHEWRLAEFAWEDVHVEGRGDRTNTR